jgi:hypothetical protein
MDGFFLTNRLCQIRLEFRPAEVAAEAGAEAEAGTEDETAAIKLPEMNIMS